MCMLRYYTNHLTPIYTYPYTHTSTHSYINSIYILGDEGVYEGEREGRVHI